MTDERLFDHRPDPELGAALRHALGPGDEAAFVARVMAGYDATLTEVAVPMWEVLAGWARPAIAAAALAAALGGIVLGRALRAPAPPPDAPATLEAAMAPTSGPGLTALVTAAGPPDASVVFASLVEQR